VPCPPALGNDQVERLAQRVLTAVSEDGLGAAVPEPDDTLAVGVDDAFRHGVHDPAKRLVRQIFSHRRSEITTTNDERAGEALRTLGVASGRCRRMESGRRAG
jgi:hypothetical protein